MKKLKVLIIVGPTASGKKKLALEAAERFGGEIVSADSRKVYRFMDIGTAKPSHEDRAHIPHHLIDVVDPDESFSAGEWTRRASREIHDIIQRGKLPIISGGTGFYISAFSEGLTKGFTSDPKIRKELEKEFMLKGASFMYRKLTALDPVRASELHEHDSVRILRALEIYFSTGHTFTEMVKNEKNTGGDYDYLTVGMALPRAILNRRINDRVDDMISRGLVDEVKNVLAMGYSRKLPAFNTVGYKEWFAFFDNRETFEQCLVKMKQNTRRYAKRQMTWFRAKKDIRWIDACNDQTLANLFEEVSVWAASR
ncbi:MAG TPA: tRNA (adenosine(37)-N6)-dimethylallyltransferase MiaA [Anaerolineae bacterium]|nr:tRNA (adenosine(37)-N6)-dimethylallyltransferase MiaA [Anaerolineae bacterium]